MKDIRVYKEYQKLLPKLFVCNDKTFEKITGEIEELCLNILDASELAKEHNQKVENYINEPQMKVGKDYEFKLDKNNRVENLIELCFLVNKVTKEVNLDGWGRKIIENTAGTIWEKNKNRKRAIIGIKDNLSKKYKYIYQKLNSNIEDVKKDGLKEYLRLEKNNEADVFDLYYEYTSNSDYWYTIKRGILAQIIKEFANNPKKYQNYNYGFLLDEKKRPVFAVSVPGHEGTYQFHITDIFKNETIYDINCIEDVKYPFADLARGNKEISKKQIIMNKKDIMNLDELAKDLENLKQEAKKYKTEDQINELEKKNNYLFRRIFLLSVVLGKDPGEELASINETVRKLFVKEQKLFLNEEKKYTRTVADKEKHKNIIRNVMRYRRIYYSSDLMDSKVAVESIINEIRDRERTNNKKVNVIYVDSEEDIEIAEKENKNTADTTNIFVKQIRPGTAPDKKTINLTEEQKGLYLNTSKDGYYESKVIYVTGKENRLPPPPNVIKVNANENMREISVCGALEKYGFRIPRDIVRYANDISAAITEDCRNAYILAHSLKGDKIIELCNEIQKEGKTLVTASLTDEQLERYGLEEESHMYDEQIKRYQQILEYAYLVENDKKNIDIIYENKDENGKKKYYYKDKNGEKIETDEQAINPDKVRKKIGINRDENIGFFCFYVAYAQGADYVLSINEKENDPERVTFAIQANPQKGDLPANVRREVYKKTLGRFESIRDILNEKTRIIVGGKTRPDIFMQDERTNKNDMSYMEFIIKKFTDLTKEYEEKKMDDKYMEDMVKKIMDVCEKDDINKEMAEIINFKQKRDAHERIG